MHTVQPRWKQKIVSSRPCVGAKIAVQKNQLLAALQNGRPIAAFPPPLPKKKKKKKRENPNPKKKKKRGKTDSGVDSGVQLQLSSTSGSFPPSHRGDAAQHCPFQSIALSAAWNLCL